MALSFLRRKPGGGEPTEPTNPITDTDTDTDTSEPLVSRRTMILGTTAGFLLASCASPNNPQAASPSENVPPSAPETSSQKPEMFPNLTSEAIYDMTPRGIMEATRVPEGTSPEEWAEKYYPEIEDKLLNSIGSSKNLEKWRAIEGNEMGGSNAVTSNDFTEMMFKKIQPALRQLIGEFDTKGDNGIHSYVNAAWIVHFAREQGLNVPEYRVTHTIKDVKATSDGAEFEYTIQDTIDADMAEMLTNSLGLKHPVAVQDPGLYRGILKGLHYDTKDKTMKPTSFISKAPENS